jgi:hypothetical protein
MEEKPKAKHYLELLKFDQTKYLTDEDLAIPKENYKFREAVLAYDMKYKHVLSPEEEKLEREAFKNFKELQKKTMAEEAAKNPSKNIDVKEDL